MNRIHAAVILVLLTGTALVSTAEAQPEADRALRAYVAVTVTERSASGGVPEPRAFGSGVLISRKGHVLTAWHVVKLALDNEESAGDDVVQRKGHEVEVQFAGPDSQPEQKAYRAEILRYSKDHDVALLQIELQPDDVISRRAGLIDYARAQIDCPDDCLRIWGVTVQRPQNGPVQRVIEYSDAAPARELDANYKRQLKSAMAEGYSGGPVFYKGETPWRLVGIGSTGLTGRPVTNFMVSIHASNPLVDPIREEVEIVGRRTFPSARFLVWANVGELSRATETLVADRVKSDPSAFAERILEEDFTQSTDEAVSIGRRLMEIAADGVELRWKRSLFKRFLFFVTFRVQSPDRKVPVLYSRLIEKLTSVSRERDWGGWVERWSHDALVYQYHCDGLGEVGERETYRCRYRAVSRFRQIWQGHLRHAYQEVWKETPEIISRVVGVAVDHLLNWAELLSQIVTKAKPDELAMALQRFRWPERISADERKGPDEVSATMVFRDAVLDKLFFADELMRSMADDSRFSTLYAEHYSRLQRWCQAIKREVKLVRDLEPAGTHYDLFLERKQNQIEKRCR